MKKTIINNGIYAGLLVAVFMSISSYFMMDDGMHFDYGMYWGFSSQIIALSFIFIGIRQYRNNYGEGKITFGKAFSVGIGIALIASVFYVLTWEVIFNNFASDFMVHYTEYEVKQRTLAGLSGAELESFKAEMAQMTQDYNKAYVRMPYTFAEIFPTGLIMTLIASLVYKKK
jgi:hypothetical protein